MLTPLVCGVVIRLKRNPLPCLIALACASNVGSVATITGNPQNILIGSSSGIGYLYWLSRLGPIAVIGMAIVIAVVWLLYPGEFRAKGAVPVDKAIAMPATPQHVPMDLETAGSQVYTATLRILEGRRGHYWADVARGDCVVGMRSILMSILTVLRERAHM